MDGPGASTTASSTTSGGLVKIVHTSTSAAAAVATPAKRSEDGLERIVARAFGQAAADMSAEKRDALPVVVKKVRNHQQAKRRAWQHVI